MSKGASTTWAKRPSLVAVLLLTAALLLPGAAAAQQALKDAVADRLGGAAAEPPPPIVNGVPFEVRFDGQVRGLQPGASVEIHGIRIGQVQSIRLVYDEAANAFAVLVAFELQPDLFPAVGSVPSDAAETYTAVDTLVRRGLRARLASQQLIGGALVVELELMVNQPAAELDRSGALPRIPAGPSTAEQVKARLQALIAKFSDIPVDELVGDLKQSLAALQALVEGPELKEALANLRDGSAALETFVEGLDGKLDRVTGSISGTLDGVTARLSGTLDRADAALADVRRTFGERSPLLADVRRLLRELDGAARSLRLMADYLERHPDALLRGKKEVRP